MAGNVAEIILRARDKASKTLEGAQGKWSGFGKTMAKVGAAVAVAGAAIAASMFKIAKSTAEYGDKIQKAGIATGATTEFLSTMGFAAEQSGGSLELIIKSVSKLQKTALDASRGLETYKRAFDDMGISVTDQNEQLKSAEVLFLEVAEALSKEENATLRAGLASEIFGQRMAKDLIPLMAEGAAGINKLREEARALGLEFSKLEADQAAEFIDAMNRAEKSIEGLTQSAGKLLIPKLAEWADKVTDWIEVNDDLIEQKVETTIYAIGSAAEFAANMLGGAARAGSGYLEVLRDINEESKESSGAFLDFMLGSQRMTEAMGVASLEQKKMFDNANAAADRWIRKNKVLHQELGAQEPTLDLLIGLYPDLGDEIDEVTDSTEDLTEATKEGNTTFVSFADTMNNLDDALSGVRDRYEEALDALKRYRGEAIADPDQYSSPIGPEEPDKPESALEAFMAGIGTMMELNDLTYEWGSAIKQAMDDLSYGLARALVTGKRVDDVMKQVGQSILTHMVGALVKFIAHQTIAILKAIILKILSFGFLSGGGKAAGGGIATAAMGGIAIQRFQQSGLVQNTPTLGFQPVGTDSVLAALTPGEPVFSVRDAGVLAHAADIIQGTMNRPIRGRAQGGGRASGFGGSGLYIEKIELNGMFLGDSDEMKSMIAEGLTDAVERGTANLTATKALKG